MFSVTYEIVTPESAEYGDAEERGFICQGESLRDAIDCLFETRTSQCAGLSCIEPSDSCHESARWITAYNGIEYETGAHENRSLHFPANITASSRKRLIALLVAM